MKQVFNPYLPSYEYIPDGEPHVFDDRVYLFGSHDKFGGKKFCMNDYVCYSADIHDLKNWRSEGVIYRRTQDPLNKDGKHYMWAPDAARGADGRYYLYYCFDTVSRVCVAVSDTPAGTYEFYGYVKYPDGVILGEKDGDYIQFDPGVYVEDEEHIYLYSGNGPRTLRDKQRKHSQVMRLEKDMLTLKEEPGLLLPGLREAVGTGFEDHAFFEASSVRKIKNRYYLVYSSVHLHELCYAVSSEPDRGYEYGGVLISNGDIFPGMSIKDSLNCYGNNHGGLVKAGEQWYIFYHRQTNRSMFSRQACAEQIRFCDDDGFEQTELTSCGLNDGPLKGTGTYGAYIACHLTGKNGAELSHVLRMKNKYPYFTQDGDDRENDPGQYIKNMKDGAAAGYKYFSCRDVKEVSIEIRGKAMGMMEVAVSGTGKPVGNIPVKPSADWRKFSSSMNIPDGVQALYFTYRGKGKMDFRSFTLK